MDPIKLDYVERVFNLVLTVTQRMVEDTNDSIESVLKITSSDALVIIQKIIIGLPERHLFHITREKMNSQVDLIAKLFILFQAQENIDDVDYPYNLINFIERVSWEMDKMNDKR